MTTSENLDIRKLADEVRAAAKQAGVTEDVVNNALDAIRAASADAEDGIDPWAAINEQIGKAQDPHWQQQLIELRTRFEADRLRTEFSRLDETFSKSPDEGWKSWLATLTAAMVRFRLRFCQSFCEHSFPFPEPNKQTVEKLRKVVLYMFQSRWPETYEQIDDLSRQDFLPPVTQARLCVIAGQIQLYHFVTPIQAKECFDRAERLAPADFKVLSGVGDYWASEKDLTKARSYYERSIVSAPRMPSGYVGMGESFEGENDFETAGQWYSKAIANASGDSLGFEKLLKLYGRPELFKEHEGELQGLMQNAVAVCPEDEYQVCTDIGFCYEQNDHLREAQNWYEKAISLDPKRPSGYVTLAQFYEKQGLKDAAEDSYKKAIDAAPECYEGYWGLTWFYEQQEKWKEALDWFEQAPKHIEEWAGIARARAGEMHWKLENYSLAEDILKQELRANQNNETAKNVLQSFATDYYKKLNDKDSAARVYREILDMLGNAFLGDYHNRLGNMSYFYDDYSQAAKEYLAAIEAKPNTPVFHRNLSEAYKQLKEYAQARQALDEAFRIDQDSTILNSEMALVVNAEANDYYAKGDYRRAIDLYTQATELDAGNEVIHANLGGAWEELREPGKRLEALDNAIKAYQAAYNVKSTAKYDTDLARLQRKREFALRYGEKAIDWLHVVTPIAVEVASDLIPLTEGIGTALSDELSKELADMKVRVQNEFGVRVPGVRFRGNEEDMPTGSYLIMINEIPLVMGTLDQNQRFLPEATAATLEKLGVEGLEAINPLNSAKGHWIKRDDWEKIEKTGLRMWNVLEYLIRHLESVIQRNLIEFLGHQEVVDLVQIEAPASVEELRTSPGKLAALTAVCRGLLTELVPIKPFPEVFKTFDGLYSPTTNLQQIVESVRSLPTLRSQLPGNNSQYWIVNVSQRFETEIRNSIYKSGAGSILAMEPENCQNALSAVRVELGSDTNAAVVVEDAPLRPYLRLLLELEFPNNPVLSRRELQTDIDFKPLGLIELDEETTPAKPDFTNPRNLEISTNGHENGGRLAPDNKIGITVFVNETVLGNKAGADDQPLREMLSMMEDGLFYELGVVLPEVRVETDNNLKAHEFRFEINGRKFEPSQGLKPDEFLVNDVIERLRLLNIEGRATLNPANGNECAIVTEDETSVETCRQFGLTTWGPAGFLVLALSSQIRKTASTFQTLDTTQYILDSLNVAFPELIGAALKRFSVEQICLVLKDLLEEEISIRDLRSILESLLSIKGTTDVDLGRYIVFIPQAHSLCPVAGNRGLDDLRISDYSDFVRSSLKRYISHKYTRGSNTLIVYLLDREIEKRLSTISTQPLTSEESSKFIAAVNLEVGSLPPTAQNPVLLTTMDLRRTVRKLIEKEQPNLAVLSYQELSPDMNIQPIARISLD